MKDSPLILGEESFIYLQPSLSLSLPTQSGTCIYCSVHHLLFLPWVYSIPASILSLRFETIRKLKLATVRCARERQTPSSAAHASEIPRGSWDDTPQACGESIGVSGNVNQLSEGYISVVRLMLRVNSATPCCLDLGAFITYTSIFEKAPARQGCFIPSSPSSRT